MSQALVLSCEALRPYATKGLATKGANVDRARNDGGRYERIHCPANGGHYHFIRVPRSSKRRAAAMRNQRSQKR